MYLDQDHTQALAYKLSSRVERALDDFNGLTSSSTPPVLSASSLKTSNRFVSRTQQFLDFLGTGNSDELLHKQVALETSVDELCHATNQYCQLSMHQTHHLAFQEAMIKELKKIRGSIEKYISSIDPPNDGFFKNNLAKLNFNDERLNPLSFDGETIVARATILTSHVEATLRKTSVQVEPSLFPSP